jgi:hypothetical protein
MNAPFKDLFKIGPGPITLVIVARVAVAVGVPLLGCVLVGLPLAGVLAGATAMLVTMADIGDSARERGATMLATMLAMLVGGVVGAQFGRTTYADETVVLLSALLAGWVSGSHPGIAAVARFAAVATAAGAGIKTSGIGSVVAVVLGGLWAVLVAFAAWKLSGLPADVNHMDWRAGVRRALFGADAGPRFALCYAGTAALALLFADQLGVTNAYWATLTTIMVMRREGMTSITLAIHYMVGTLVGIPIADVLFQTLPQPIAIAAAATAAAAFVRIGLALNPAIGFTAFTVFLLLVVDLAMGRSGSSEHLLAVRFYDVSIGCALALAGTIAASVGARRTPQTPDAKLPSGDS